MRRRPRDAQPDDATRERASGPPFAEACIESVPALRLLGRIALHIVVWRQGPQPTTELLASDSAGELLVEKRGVGLILVSSRAAVIVGVGPHPASAFHGKLLELGRAIG